MLVRNREFLRLSTSIHARVEFDLVPLRDDPRHLERLILALEVVDSEEVTSQVVDLHRIHMVSKLELAQIRDEQELTFTELGVFIDLEDAAPRWIDVDTAIGSWGDRNFEKDELPKLLCKGAPVIFVALLAEAKEDYILLCQGLDRIKLGLFLASLRHK